MAITISNPITGVMSGPIVPGSQRRSYVKIQFDSAYPNTGTYATSGYAITAALAGMASVLFVNVCGPSSAGFPCFWDLSAGRLHIYDTADDAEWENNTDFTTKGPGSTNDYVLAELIGT